MITACADSLSCEPMKNGSTQGPPRAISTPMAPM